MQLRTCAANNQHAISNFDRDNEYEVENVNAPNAFSKFCFAKFAVAVDLFWQILSGFADLAFELLDLAFEVFDLAFEMSDLAFEVFDLAFELSDLAFELFDAAAQCLIEQRATKLATLDLAHQGRKRPCTQDPVSQF